MFIYVLQNLENPQLLENPKDCVKGVAYTLLLNSLNSRFIGAFREKNQNVSMGPLCVADILCGI